MSYFVYRNQQESGPYSLQDLQSYIASGSVTAADHVRDDQGGAWTTVGQLLNPPAAPIAYQAPAAPIAVQPVAVAASGAPAVPLPPNLHWALVLLIGMVFSPFVIVWVIVQMVWVRHIDKQSKALMFYLIALIGYIVFAGIGVASLLSHSDNPGIIDAIPFLLATFLGLFFGIKSLFDVRRSMVTYYNSVEPIGLRMSGAMTFFFSVYYFQYHMSRIATWKTTGVLSPQG